MPSRLAPLLLSVVGPASVLGLGLLALEQVRTHADEREAANAGRILNGNVLHDEDVVQAMDVLLETTTPRVVVLGNSLANTDLRVSVLAEAMGLELEEVQKLTVPNSMAAHWYAILKNRVFARGHRPEVVLVLSDLQSLLALAPRSEGSHVNLAVQLGPEEPVVDAKLGRRWWHVERVRQGRSLLRQDLLDLVRDASSALLWWRDPEVAGTADDALDRVFADTKVDHALHRRVIPVFADEAPPDVALALEDLAPPDEGFLPEIVKLAREHGSDVVLARPPMSPLMPKGQGDVVPPASGKRVPGLVHGLGGHWVDLRTLPVRAWQFQNLDHMNEEGARRFSWRLGELITEDLGLLRSEEPDLELLVDHRVRHGRWVVRRPEVTWPVPPMRLPRASRAAVAGRGDSAFFETPTFAFLSDANVLELTEPGTRCSPVRVLEDRKTLPLHNTLCEEVFDRGHGRVCHMPDRVIFTASDGSDPVHNPFTYTLALDENRWCESGLWTYPMDVAVLAGEGDREVGLVSATLIDVGTTNRGGPQAIRIRALRGEEVLADRTLSLAQARYGPSIPLSGPATAGDLAIELTNDSDHFLLWTSVRLGPAVESGDAVESP